MRIREYWTALPVVFHGFLVVCDASLCSFLVFFLFLIFFGLVNFEQQAERKHCRVDISREV